MDTRKEEEILTELISKIRSIQIPPHQRRVLGLSEDWQEQISSNFIQKAFLHAARLKDVLRELSKH